VKKLLYMPLVLLLFLSISFAQNGIDTKKRIKNVITPLMSKVLNLLTIKAKTLDLTEKQKEELDLIQEKYIFPLAIKEAEHNISRMKVVNIIQDPNFDPTEAKRLVEIRKVIGIENYKMIISRVVMQ